MLLFHISDAGRWPQLLANARNALKADPNTAIRVVANGQAPVSVCAVGNWRRELEALAEGGVDVAICGNSVEGLGLDPQHLPRGTRIIPAGIIAIAEAQDEGYRYLKP